MISKEEVEKIAKLARLSLTSEEYLMMQKDLSSILDYINLLKKAKHQSNQKPHGSKSGEVKESLREDEAKSLSTETIEKLLKEVPDKKERYIKVKAILD